MAEGRNFSRRISMTGSKVKQRKARVTRDTAILSFAICAAAFEIVLGGARPSVLTFITGIFFSPLIIRADERQKDD
jgi:hypothetical protein